MHNGLTDILKVEYNDPHKHHSKLRGFPFTSSINTFRDSHKLPTVLVRKVKRKPRNFEQICVDHCILLLKHLSYHIAFYNKRLQTLFRPTQPIQGNVFIAVGYPMFLRWVSILGETDDITFWRVGDTISCPPQNLPYIDSLKEHIKCKLSSWAFMRARTLHR